MVKKIQLCCHSRSALCRHRNFARLSSHHQTGRNDYPVPGEMTSWLLLRTLRTISSAQRQLIHLSEVSLPATPLGKFEDRVCSSMQPQASHLNPAAEQDLMGTQQDGRLRRARRLPIAATRACFLQPPLL